MASADATMSAMPALILKNHNKKYVQYFFEIFSLLSLKIAIANLIVPVRWTVHDYNMKLYHTAQT
jgi:hypothetical protein